MLLVVNADEAARVQEIFAIAAAAGTLAEALQRVNHNGNIISRQTIRAPSGNSEADL